MTTISFQGELGAFSEDAARRFFADQVEPIPHRTFAEVGEAVIEERVDYGLLPIENSLAGSVVGSYDVLAAPELVVVGEVVTPIHHCLLGVAGVTLDQLTHVFSHPVALAQCQRFFQTNSHLEAVAFYDTAGAAKEIAGRANPAHAAIAGRPAADRYDLEILAADIEDRHDNQTRFLVVSRAENAERVVPSADAMRGDTRKTALLIETKNVPGALVRVLLPFADRGYNLTKLESRPGIVPWSYRFFIEVEADTSDAELGAAIGEAREFTSLFRVLGSFPRWMGE
ncbi:MAG: prephenate dehydratase [Gemmatimonadetes bacterium]|nr:prephenate dehydratase [Gemmatimonadota bacterium]